MNYEKFENHVVNTFNRMRYVESCDDGYLEFGFECDVCGILSKAMKEMFHIEHSKQLGNTVSRETLLNLYLDDLDGVLTEALNSFNDIMNKYNVVPHNLAVDNYILGLKIV